MSTPTSPRPTTRRPGRSRLRAAVAAAICTVTASAVLAAPATAADPHDDLAANYTSLSASLIGFYAAKSQQSVGDYLTTQQLLLKPAALDIPGLDDTDALETLDQDGLATGDNPDAVDPTPGAVPQADLEALDVASLSAAGGLLLSADQIGSLTGQAAPVQADSVAALNAQLAAGGVTLSNTKFKSLSQLAKQVTRSARTPDGAVTLASAKWANDLSQLRAPGLKTPGTPGAGAPGVPADALPLGLLMNRSLTNLVTNHPNLIAQAQNSAGLGSKGLVKAWNTSMAQAYADSTGDLKRLLPNPCVGEMMGVMATGKPSSTAGKCAPACTVAGQYLHNQSGAAFDPKQNDLTSNANNPAGGVLNHATFTNMATWAQQLVATGNPKLIGSNSEVAQKGNGPRDCQSASYGAKTTVATKLPGLFAGLK